MEETRPIPTDTPDDSIDGDLFEHIGEVVSIPETLVVSPSRGRFHRETLAEGSNVHAGTLIGRVAFNGGDGLRVTARVDGVFLGWLAWDGEILQRGTPVARIGFSENGSKDGAANGNGAAR